MYNAVSTRSSDAIEAVLCDAARATMPAHCHHKCCASPHQLRHAHASCPAARADQQSVHVLQRAAAVQLVLLLLLLLLVNHLQRCAAQPAPQALLRGLLLLLELLLSLHCWPLLPQ
jgi:hypothetical protein